MIFTYPKIFFCFQAFKYIKDKDRRWAVGLQLLADAHCRVAIGAKW